MSIENLVKTSGCVFATTHWTAVLTAGRGGSPQADLALEELCHTYWYPLYAFIRRQGRSREDAEDLAQGFFARLLQKIFWKVSPATRGGFAPFCSWR